MDAAAGASTNSNVDKANPIETSSASTSASTSNSLPSAPGQRRRARTSKPKVKTGCTNCKYVYPHPWIDVLPECYQSSLCGLSTYKLPLHLSGNGASNVTKSDQPVHNAPFEEIRIAPKPILAVESHQSSDSAPLHREFVLPPRRVRHRSLRIPSPNALHRRAPSPTTYQPSFCLPFQSSEALYFDIFRAQTATELSGYFDSTFWARLVLQECHSEAAIRHAVVALGALYQTLEESAESSSGGRSSPRSQKESAMGHWQVAVKEYSEACNALVLLNGQTQRSHKTLIMASVLLACFDSFIGDHKQAIIQIQNGLSLLERLRVKKGSQPLPAPDDPLEQELVTMFTRLAIQAKTYDMAFHFPHPYVIRLTSQSQSPPTSPASTGGSSPGFEGSFSIPDHFESLREARTANDRLNDSMIRFIEGLFAAKSDLKGTLPRSWINYGIQFKGQLDAWSDAFEHILQSRTAPSTSPQEKAGIAALKMTQINCQVLFSMMFSDKESQFDAFLPHFQAIVALGLEIVVDEEARAAAKRCPDPSQCQHRRKTTSKDFIDPAYCAPHIKPSFSADLGIIPQLFVVATKCRDPVTRRQAIQLLRSSARREGMWDSELAAHIGTWIMNLEESESEDVLPQRGRMEGEGPANNEDTKDSNSRYADAHRMGVVSRTIPEEKRVMVRSVDFDLRARFADLQVGTRGLQPGLHDDKFHQTNIRW
ncbi:hypothetical protein G7046_g7697 [Stylonectria norvegica]|nr:hypothetical protein G7046_g7697 [Stylonectria norvegica]